MEIFRPGLHYVNVCTEKIHLIDKKTQTLELQQQIVVSKDNITFSLDATVLYRITDSVKSLYMVQNIENCVQYLTISTLRNIIGQYTIQDFLEKRKELTHAMELYIDEHIQTWGVKVEHIFIKDIFLSQDIQDPLSSAAKERRKAESKIISAKADVESAKLLREAADILATKCAMQIRYYETVQQISRSPNPKIVFLPFDEHFSESSDDYKKLPDKENSKSNK